MTTAILISFIHPSDHCVMPKKESGKEVECSPIGWLIVWWFRFASWQPLVGFSSSLQLNSGLILVRHVPKLDDSQPLTGLQWQAPLYLKVYINRKCFPPTSLWGEGKLSIEPPKVVLSRQMCGPKQAWKRVVCARFSCIIIHGSSGLFGKSTAFECKPSSRGPVLAQVT